MTTRHCSSLLAALGIVIGVSAAEAQISFEEDDNVTLKLPTSVLELEGRRILNGSPIYAAEIRPGEAGVVVNRSENWMLTAFPSLIALRIDNIDEDDDFTEVELRNDAINVKLRFSSQFADLNNALGQTVAVGTPTDTASVEYRQQVYSLIGERVFDGPLSAVAPESRQLLLLFADATAAGTGISHEQFRGEEYLVVDLGADSNVYNTLQMNQTQRIARILNDRLLNVLKAFAEPVRDVEVVFGVKLDFEIPYRNFLDDDAEPDHDVVRLYASSDDVKAFADFEITSQEFIDRSFVIVNENRVQIPLSEG